MLLLSVCVVQNIICTSMLGSFSFVRRLSIKHLICVSFWLVCFRLLACNRCCCCLSVWSKTSFAHPCSAHSFSSVFPSNTSFVYLFDSSVPFLCLQPMLLLSVCPKHHLHIHVLLILFLPSSHQTPQPWFGWFCLLPCCAGRGQFHRLSAQLDGAGVPKYAIRVGLLNLDLVLCVCLLAYVLFFVAWLCLHNAQLDSVGLCAMNSSLLLFGRCFVSACLFTCHGFACTVHGWHITDFLISTSQNV